MLDLYLPYDSLSSKLVRHGAHDAVVHPLIFGKSRTAWLILQYWHIVARSGAVRAHCRGLSYIIIFWMFSIILAIESGLGLPNSVCLVCVLKRSVFRKFTVVWSLCVWFVCAALGVGVLCVEAFCFVIGILLCWVGSLIRESFSGSEHSSSSGSSERHSESGSSPSCSESYPINGSSW